MSIDNVAVFIC